MKSLILAGGSGTRLWPLSRKNYPKQFLKLNSNRSLLQQTVERLLNTVSLDDIVVLTNSEYKFHVASDLNSLTSASTLSSPPSSPSSPSSTSASTLSSSPSPLNIILEPASRNTAPAIALGIKYCMEKLGCKEDEVIFISPADHIISPVDKFAEYIRLSEKIAGEGYMVTFGIKPLRPETGYGYIKVSSKQYGAGSMRSAPDAMRHACYRVEEFKEKPDEETAKRYVDEGDYYWNSGMFAFSIGTIIEEFSRHVPEISEMLGMSFEEMILNFEQMPDTSIDYAVMERSDRVVTLPLDLYWNDIGSWDSLYDVMDKDESGNVKKGDVLAIDTKETFIIGDKRLISTIGLEDCLIVETGDAILIAKRGETQKVKRIVNELKEGGRKEAAEHLTIYRPWGSYTVLEEGQRYKIKRIVVNPDAKLSLQKHYHRSEHWVVVSGTAKVTIGEGESFIHENESAYVPKSTLHRLENPGKVPLEIIEVQNGEYLGEDDILRVDDSYGR